MVVLDDEHGVLAVALGLLHDFADALPEAHGAVLVAAGFDDVDVELAAAFKLPQDVGAAVGALGQVDDVGGQEHARHVGTADGLDGGCRGGGIERAYLRELLQQVAGPAEESLDAPVLVVDGGGVGIAKLALLADVRVGDEEAAAEAAQMDVGDVALVGLRGQDAGVATAEHDGELHAVEARHPEQMVAHLHGAARHGHAARKDVGLQGVGLGDAVEEKLRRIVGREDVVVLAEDEEGQVGPGGALHDAVERLPQGPRAVGQFDAGHDGETELGAAGKLLLDGAAPLGAAGQVDGEDGNGCFHVVSVSVYI